MKPIDSRCLMVFILSILSFPSFSGSNSEYGDIINGLPLPEKSCKAIYCSHFLEHLSLQDFRTALKNTFAIYVID